MKRFFSALLLSAFGVLVAAGALALFGRALSPGWALAIFVMGLSTQYLMEGKREDN